MRLAPRPSRAPHRQLRVTCEGSSRLAVGRRPAAPSLDAPVVDVVESQAWSRGLWGTFLPERRAQIAQRAAGQPERRRHAA